MTSSNLKNRLEQAQKVKDDMKNIRAKISVLRKKIQKSKDQKKAEELRKKLKEML